MSQNLTIVAGHVLLPHAADWSVTPKVSRTWRSPVDIAQSGIEDRVTVRPSAWQILQYQVLPFDHVERARFDERFMAGMKSGKVAVPRWGGGITLENDADEDETSLVLTRTNHGISAGTYLFIQHAEPAEYDTWDVCLATIVDDETVTIASGLGNGYVAGERIWPLFFGKPSMGQYPVMNSARGRYSVEVQNDGRIIHPSAEDTFETYSTGAIGAPLDGGPGWDGPWVIADLE